MLIEVKNLTFKYEKDGKDVLKNISFNIEEGEFVSIIGHNGSGKSTLARLLLGLEEVKDGEIYINSLLFNEENSYEIRKNIGIIFQNPDNQFVASSIEDDIAFGLENLEIDRSLMEEKIDRSLKAVSLLDYKKRMPSELSGGEKQRAAIAAIIAMEPKIIIFDEATSMLDPKGRDEVLKLILKLHEDGKTIIMITHDMDEVLKSDRTIILSDGEIIKDGPSLEVLADYESLNKAHLEMPSDIYLYHYLRNNNYKNEDILNALWESILKK